MKVNAQQVVAQVNQSGSKIAAVLVFGPDHGLVTETAENLVSSVAGKPADPFLLAELSSSQLKADQALLDDEMRSLPLMGPRKVIYIRQATDVLAAPIEALLKTGNIQNLLVVAAGELPPRSKLRKIFEAAKTAAGVACYSDDRGSLEGLVHQMLSAANVSLEPDAMTELLGRLGNDRLVSRGEINKLVLYAGDNGRVSAQDVISIVGDNAALSIDAVIFDAADGATQLADQALARAFADGASPVQVLRALQRHFQRLHMVAGELAQGARLDAALGRLRPPVFFKFKSRFQSQCRRWSLGRLTEAMNLVTDAERQCKQTGAPDVAICQRAVLRISAAARKQT